MMQRTIKRTKKKEVSIENTSFCVELRAAVHAAENFIKKVHMVSGSYAVLTDENSREIPYMLYITKQNRTYLLTHKYSKLSPKFKRIVIKDGRKMVYLRDVKLLCKMDV